MPTDVVARPCPSADQAPHPAAPVAVTAAFHRFAALDDGPVKERLQEELMRAWLPMAHRLAARFRDRGESPEDLRQVAALGLLKAIRRFDPDRGPFEPFAIPTIRGEIRRHFRDRTWGVRVPRRVQELRNRVRAAYVELTLVPGSPRPTAADLARHTGLSEEEVRDGMEALESYRALSLDAAGGDGGAEAEGPPLADVLGETDHSFELVVDRESVKESVRRLPSRERAILYLRFFEDWSQSRIAERMGISQMHVSRLLSQTCARIRRETLDPR
ncbi:RNA polymerase sigma factor [Streptomyces viridiviolaceus]|uniref:SigB/SigF/SigG family RNA polymerase sigma factor n=1 Tax=Streptomyces viridiviolaceus TaxID=68282 RepID=A0ABW2DV97_9ACTN|nr:SigB/SigF/SigG family RNA polymerase sigma factor [Streptomyces viridiviolaceus]GHB32923.1 RNA polymerase sigma factor [Streptomyces viridiviolaceus]